MIKNILFDLGGVFIHLTRDESVRRFESLGIHDADAMLDPYKQSGFFLGLESGAYTEQEFADALNEHYHLQLTTADIGWALRGFVPIIQEEKFHFVREELSPKYRILLVSNTNPFVHSFAESAEFLSTHEPLHAFFEKVYASYELKVCKPEVKIFNHIIEDSGIRPEETLFVDDGPANVAIGRELGFVTYCPDNGEDWIPVLRKMLLP